MKNINQKEIVDLIQTRLPLFFGDQKERFQVEFHTMRKETSNTRRSASRCRTMASDSKFQSKSSRRV